MDKPDKKDWKDVGFAYYKALFAGLDAAECAARCQASARRFARA